MLYRSLYTCTHDLSEHIPSRSGHAVKYIASFCVQSILIVLARLHVIIKIYCMQLYTPFILPLFDSGFSFEDCTMYAYIGI